MPENDLDCKGLACPQPVLQCKQCIDNDNPREMTVAVDNEAARENVARFLTSRGFETQSMEEDGTWTIRAVRDGRSPAMDGESSPKSDKSPKSEYDSEKDGQSLCVFIGQDVMGAGDDDLGAKLMFNFLTTLPELDGDLWRIILINAGVKLAVDGHPAVEKLKDLERAGVSILVCGTCLDHFGLLNDKQVGQTTNMLDVVTSLQLASKVIRV